MASGLAARALRPLHVSHIATPFGLQLARGFSTRCRHDHKGHGEGSANAPIAAAEEAAAEEAAADASASSSDASHGKSHGHHAHGHEHAHGDHGHGGHDHGAHGGAAHQIQHRAVEKVSFKVLEKVRDCTRCACPLLAIACT